MSHANTDDSDPAFVALAEKLHWSMFRIAAAFRRQEYTRVKRDELTLTQCSILYRLREQAPLHVSDLASIENVAGPTMTIAIGRLEQLGMVARRRDTSDKRHIWIELTPRGRAAPRDAVTAMIDAMRSALTEEDLVALEAVIGPLQALAKLSDAQGRSR